jgi:hypothetical protein
MFLDRGDDPGHDQGGLGAMKSPAAFLAPRQS